LDQSFTLLNARVVVCTRCPRLVAYRETVPFRKVFASEEGWRRPVPGFGDPHAWLLILGLAPSIEGANRTGRIFTGDASARFLIPLLYRAGFANQPNSISKNDGLKFTGCYVTASVKCVPPQHQPLKEEVSNCSSYLENEFFLLSNLKSVLALGKLAFDTYQNLLVKQGALQKKEAFAHAKSINCSGWPTLFGAYHPTPQNTNTGKLTEQMFYDLLVEIKRKADMDGKSKHHSNHSNI
jgi:uracil-DNA glycosylase family 4